MDTYPASLEPDRMHSGQIAKKSRTSLGKSAARSGAALSSTGTHVLVVFAIASVSLALGICFIVALAAPAALAVAVSGLFAVLAAALHITLCRTADTKALRPIVQLRRVGDVTTLRKGEVSASEKPVADSVKSPQEALTVEPSDLALALLASLSSATMPSRTVGDGLGEAQFTADAPIAETVRYPDESEFERVDRLVKRLADNVNHLQAVRDAQVQSTNPAETQRGVSRPIARALDTLSETTNSELVASITALKLANAAAVPVHPSQTSLAWPAEVRTSVAPVPSHQRTAILAALNAERLDVFLEPILDLGEQRPQHYEVSIALKTAEGYLIDLTDAACDLSGTGLLPLIDQARIAHAAAMARRLADRGKHGALFTGLSGETLGDPGFTDTFATTALPVGAFPGHLVLTLSQAHVATFANADWHTLARLREAGFGFALSDVTMLDMDFTYLAEVGFTFARLDAQIFLEGLPTAGGVVAPSDICRHMAASGLMLIVGGIVDDYQLAKIFGFGVVFGQGRLFGGPRAAKIEIVPASAPANAFNAAL